MKMMTRVSRQPPGFPTSMCRRLSFTANPTMWFPFHKARPYSIALPQTRRHSFPLNMRDTAISRSNLGTITFPCCRISFQKASFRQAHRRRYYSKHNWLNIDKFKHNESIIDISVFHIVRPRTGPNSLSYTTLVKRA